MELEKGTLIHQRYRIEGILGKGGMGVVYTAIDESLGVHVVVKENSLEDQDAIRFMGVDITTNSASLVTNRFVVGQSPTRRQQIGK